MGFSEICFPTCFPISAILGKHGETFGETFPAFCDDLRRFAFHSSFYQTLKTPLNAKDSSIFARIPLFNNVELEGVEHDFVDTMYLWWFYEVY